MNDFGDYALNYVIGYVPRETRKVRAQSWLGLSEDHSCQREATKVPPKSMTVCCFLLQ